MNNIFQMNEFKFLYLENEDKIDNFQKKNLSLLKIINSAL